MGRYGAKYIRWAPFAEQTPDALDSAYPKYGTPMSLGPLTKVTDAPTFNEAKAYGDNALAEYVVEFKECQVDVEVTDLENTVASAIYGATVNESADNDVEHGIEDNPPYGGLAFYCNRMNKESKKFFQGIFYPKLKATMQGTEYATKGDSITLAGGKIKFMASAPTNGKWMVESDPMDTEEEAKAWVDAKITAAAAG